LSDISNKSSFGPLNMTVFVLSIIALVALLVETFLKLPTETSRLLNYLDFGICSFFFIEFSYQLLKAKSKTKYLKWGWIDLLSSIPMIDAFRIGRLVRIIRVIRVIKTFKSLTEFTNHVFSNKAKGTITSALMLAIIILLFSSIAILQVEDSPLSNIKSAEDALWWSYTTITTVGYGDKFPVTTEGRIIAMVLMTVGVGMFGTFTAYIASLFVKSNSK